MYTPPNQDIRHRNLFISGMLIKLAGIVRLYVDPEEELVKYLELFDKYTTKLGE